MARLVLISCASGAFRRAGFTFGHDPVLVDLDELSDGAADAIESEELLTIAEATEEDVARLSGPAVDSRPARSPDEFEALNEQRSISLEQELSRVPDELSRRRKPSRHRQLSRSARASTRRLALKRIASLVRISRRCVKARRGRGAGQRARGAQARERRCGRLRPGRAGAAGAGRSHDHSGRASIQRREEEGGRQVLNSLFA
jgi:hypothetical protein